MDTIKIDKKEYPVKFGLSVIKRFAEKRGMKSLDEFDEWYRSIDQKGLDTLDYFAELMLMGIQRGCKKENVSFDLDVDDILDLASDDPKIFSDLMAIFTNSVNPEAVEMLQASEESQTEEKKSQPHGAG